MLEDAEVTSRTGAESIINEDAQSQNTYLPFIQMEDLFEKLKLIDYENDFVKQFKLRYLNRHYFAIQTNPGEQFFVFSLLSAWLIRKCGLPMDIPQEHDDPNMIIAFILDSARNLSITVNFSPSKLRQGYGKYVVKLLNDLCNAVIQEIDFKFSKPVVPIEMNDEELVVEDDAELLLERIEEEMAAEEPDSEDDEDVFLHVDDLNKLNYHPQKMDEIFQSNITNEEWQLEVERVLPSLRLTVKTDNKDWRSHVELIKNYRATIGDSMRSVKSQLDNLTNNITETMDKIASREKYLNSNLDSLLMEHRSVQEQFLKVNNRYRELNNGVLERQRKLAKINEELDFLKNEVEERGTIMSDGTPLINIKKALVSLREDVANMNVQIAILQHDIFHSKVREKLIMQQKLQSQVYA